MWKTGSSTTTSALTWASSTISNKWNRIPVEQNLLNEEYFDCNGNFAIQVLDVEYNNSEFTPTAKIFGVTECGKSVLIRVSGFLPYFYVEREHRENPINLLNELNESFRGDFTDDPVVSVTVVRGNSIYGYQENEREFFKITVASPTAMNMICDGVSKLYSLTYENNIDAATRFMVDNNIYACRWLTMKKNTFTFLSKETQFSRCQIEIEAPLHGAITNRQTNNNDRDLLSTAPLRVLSFDIEVAGRRGIFPDAKIDPVIVIASIIMEHKGSTKRNNTREESQQSHASSRAVDFIDKVVFISGTCSATTSEADHEDGVATRIVICNNETELLLRWASYVRRSDPDVLTGYNVDNFDFRYLFERAKLLNATSFAAIGRERLSVARNKPRNSYSNGNNEFFQQHVTYINGRIVMDMLNVVRREHKLRSYTLDSVSQHFLGERKNHVHYTQITELYNGNDETRYTLAKYCLQDCLLPLKLMQKLMVLTNFTEMSRVTGIPIRTLVTRGQQVKVFALILRYARAKNLLVPCRPPFQATSQKTSYAGGLVLAPVKGFHTDPVAVLDFTSLYPSIIIAYNLCYSTMFSPSDATTVNDDAHTPRLDTNFNESIPRSPSGTLFVTRSTREGILPQILENLLEQRCIAKQLMKKEANQDKRNVYNGRQLALKVTANAVYGFTGCLTGSLPCVEVSESVTAYGRRILLNTKEIIENWNLKQPHNASVIYGDTDSVMIKFGENSVSDAGKMAKDVAKFVTQTINLQPLTLELEKVFCPFLLMSKKRYVGLYFDCSAANAQSDDAKHCTEKRGAGVVGILDCKGIETKRRDGCSLVSEVVNECLEELLVRKNVDAALSICKKVVSDLYENKIDVQRLVICKELTNKKYVSKQAHSELVKRIAARSPGSQPTLGDRVPYVIIELEDNNKRTPLHKKSEDPDYARDHRLKLDFDYYFKRQLLRPLTRIFEPIVGQGMNLQQLLSEHIERQPERCNSSKRQRKKLVNIKMRKITEYFEKKYNKK